MSNYHGIEENSILNGVGVRTVLWFSGCSHRCSGCHNYTTWDKCGGKKFDENAMSELLQTLSYEWISGLTISGGDGLMPYNVDATIEVCKKVKEVYPHLTIWIYTGYTYEEVMQNEKRRKAVELCDVLVDGKFIKELSSPNKKWVGSENQRVIDVKKSFELNQVVLFD